MDLILQSKRKGYNAKAKYDVEKKKFVVLKGFTVSVDVAQSEKFRGAKSIISTREEYVEGGIVKKNVIFKKLFNGRKLCDRQKYKWNDYLEG